MLHSIMVWLLVVALVGAGSFNAIGTRATQDDFARWLSALVVPRDRRPRIYQRSADRPSRRPHRGYDAGCHHHRRRHRHGFVPPGDLAYTTA